MDKLVREQDEVRDPVIKKYGVLISNLAFKRISVDKILIFKAITIFRQILLPFTIVFLEKVPII